MIAQSTPDHSTLVIHLTDQKISDDGGTASWIVAAPVLLAAQQHVARYRPFEPCLEAAAAIQQLVEQAQGNDSTLTMVVFIAIMVHKAPERVTHGERIGPNPAK